MMFNRRNQSGVALLLFVVVLLGASIFAFTKALNKNISQQAQEKRIDNIKRLNEAKEALLSYAVDYMLAGNNASDMGNLPCPNLPGGPANGVSIGTCGVKGVNSIGYFPYKTVGLGKIEDSSKECFWYVVSANYKNVNPLVDYGLRSWDSNGFLNVVDENGDLQHGINLEDYPIALIISPQKSINQNRAAVGTGNLSDCVANYTLSNYLEGGPNIDYSIGLPSTVDTIWTFLKASAASQLVNVDYNDQVVAIYKDEFWSRVKAMNDLDTARPAAAIRNLTKELTECLESYIQTVGAKNAIFPANLNLTDYANTALYTDVSGKRYGYFPEDITVSEGTNFTATGFSSSFISNYCPTVVPTIDVGLWDNWKDQFFLVVADDFLPGSIIPLATKCNIPGSCLDIDGAGTRNEAAIIFFAEEASLGQDRTLSAGTTDPLIWNQYLDGINQTLYIGDDATNDFDKSLNDYAYCITFAAGILSTQEC